MAGTALGRIACSCRRGGRTVGAHEREITLAVGSVLAVLSASARAIRKARASSKRCSRSFERHRITIAEIDWGTPCDAGVTGTVLNTDASNDPMFAPSN